jgi:enamine deaminase RidA (YjgF/YER057c/UK114 family)
MNTVDVRAKLKELGLELPVAAKPVAAYVPAIRTANIVFTAGQLPLANVKWLVLES